MNVNGISRNKHLQNIIWAVTMALSIALVFVGIGINSRMLLFMSILMLTLCVFSFFYMSLSSGHAHGIGVSEDDMDKFENDLVQTLVGYELESKYNDEDVENAKRKYVEMMSKTTIDSDDKKQGVTSA